MNQAKHRGLSLVGILISLACVVVLMSIYMTSMQKAVTGGDQKTDDSLWGMQDQIQIQLIGRSLSIYAITNGDGFLVPSRLSKSNDVYENTSANFWSALIKENMVKPEQLVSPTDRGWVEVVQPSYANGYWDSNFSADLSQTSNVSYAHMPLWGERLKKRWNPQAGRFPIIGSRGPEDGIDGTNSMTLDNDGSWRGWVLYADNSIEWNDGTTTTSRWRRRDGVVEDNLFLIEEEDSADDAILGVTLEMDDYGPILVWD